MKLPAVLLYLVAVHTLVACSSDEQSIMDTPDRPPYVTLDADLTQLKADFNAMTGKLRLVFISGPSCGICLRGMDDLNEAIVASLQNDPRVHTFVLYVPTLGAKEKHVKAAIPLLQGPRINHYWDPEGRSGLEFQKTMDIPMYAWDLWFIYDPGARWEHGSPPPMPGFWHHQLPGLPKELKLDADAFATAIMERLNRMPPATQASRLAVIQRADPGILPVAQPRGVMIEQNHISRGSYQTLKTISSIRYEGETIVAGKSLPLTVETERPYRYQRVTTDGDVTSTVTFDGTQVTRTGRAATDLPESIHNEFLTSYEFDGWMTDWKIKGHQVWRLGMKKYRDQLPWLMEAKLTNGRTWHIYVDSHTGDAFRQALIGSDGQETLAMEFADYRDADGFRLAHEIRYFDGDRLLATDRFAHIDVSTTPVDPRE